MSEYRRDVDDDNPGMDSNNEYQEPEYDDRDDYNYDEEYNAKSDHRLVSRAYKTTVTKLVGVTYNNSNGTSRQSILKSTLVGSALTFKHDKNNIYDCNCITVYNNKNEVMGHLSSDLAEKIAPKINNGVKYSAKVLAITGGGELNYGCNIEITSSSDNMLTAKDIITAASNITLKTLEFADALLTPDKKEETFFDKTDEVAMSSLFMSVVLGLPVYLAAMFMFGQSVMASLLFALAAMYIVSCFIFKIIASSIIYSIYLLLIVVYSFKQ